MTLNEIVRRLTCPLHGKSLAMPSTTATMGVPWPDGLLSCPSGCVFPVKGGIPRFTYRHHYARAFGLQWRRYQRTQLDSYTGCSISRARLERCLGTSLAGLTGKTVLECGAGAGRFTEWLIESAGTLVSLDLSDAVEANLKNCGGRKPYLLIQTDMNQSPLPKEAFDVVICLGVLQHTPSPEISIRSLADHVKPGGILVIDHYAKRPVIGSAGQFLTMGFPMRAVFKRLSPDTGLRATIGLTLLCDPIRKRTRRIPPLDFVVSRLLPTACYYGAFPGMPEHIVYEWNELDTHDGLTDWYKHRRSSEEIDRHVRSLGFDVLRCGPGGNGVEARAIKR